MPADTLARAEEFVLTNARLLDRHLFARLFRGGPGEPVLKALGAYQNPDGGFGNALEPDKRCPDSQPVDLEVALRVLEVAGAPGGEMVGASCAWLAAVAPEGWLPFAFPSVNAYPHAPWWSVPEDPPASLNPTAALAGLLLGFGVEHPWLDRAVAFCRRAIAETETTDFHTLMPVITFLEHAPDRAWAEAELERVAGRILAGGAVEMDPEAGGYVHPPLHWAPGPGSFCRRLFSDEVLREHLRALAAAQQADGGWPISWEAIGPAVELEWRGRVTIDALVTLKGYGEAGLAMEVER